MNKTKKQTDGLLLALVLGLVFSFSASPVYRSPTSSIPSCNVTRAIARIIAVVAMHQVGKTKATITIF